jgi:hypothetical protein
MPAHDPDKWRRGWKRVVGVLWRDLGKSFPPTHKRREAFQLLAAAFFYHTNGVWKLDDAELHAGAVTVPWNTDSVKLLFGTRRPPLFHGRRRLVPAINYFGGMHIASASGRLATSLFLLAQEPASAFCKFANRNDWNRVALAKDLPGASPGRCLTGGPVLPFAPDPNKVGPSLAVIVADRDRMAHGDVASGNNAWRKKRTAAFNQLHECQIVEAQLELLWTAVQDFKNLGG